MSRIGRAPINVPAGVDVAIDAANSVITVKGPKGTLTYNYHNRMTVNCEANVITVTRPSDEKEDRALHGLTRTLINNMVIGVSKGYEIKQELVGVGFKAEVKGQLLEMSLGYSHDIALLLPAEIQATAVTEKKGNPILTLKSADKQLVGQVAAKIRSMRKPEPYKGKGIKFVGEVIRRKAGKSAAK